VDPKVYAVAVIRETYDRVLDSYERTLAMSLDQLDRVLDSQRSHRVEYVRERVVEGLHSDIRAAVEGITDEQMDMLHTHGPKTARFIERLRTNPPLDSAAVRRIVMRWAKSFDIREVMALQRSLPLELQARVLDLFNALARAAKQL
jgi:hypothetical protein